MAPRELGIIGRKTGISFPGVLKSQGKNLPTDDSPISDEIIAEVMLKTLVADKSSQPAYIAKAIKLAAMTDRGVNHEQEISYF